MNAFIVSAYLRSVYLMSAFMGPADFFRLLTY